MLLLKHWDRTWPAVSAQWIIACNIMGFHQIPEGFHDCREDRESIL